MDNSRIRSIGLTVVVIIPKMNLIFEIKRVRSHERSFFCIYMTLPRIVFSDDMIKPEEIGRARGGCFFLFLFLLLI